MNLRVNLSENFNKEIEIKKKKKKKTAEDK